MKGGAWERGKGVSAGAWRGVKKKGGLSFISNRQRRKEGTFSASGLAVRRGLEGHHAPDQVGGVHPDNPDYPEVSSSLSGILYTWTG